MPRIPFEEAIESLVEAYRNSLEENPDNMISQWLEHFDQHAEVVDAGGDPPELFLEVEE